jgi:ABC-2 type transport system permease protein
MSSSIGVNTIGLRTLIRREIRRTIQVINQVIWPPVISTLLYILIIGMSLGGRVQEVVGVPYLTYLIPGLIALTVVESSYGESSASLFQHRFMNSIQELLISPLAYWEIVAGFIMGSVTRALILGNMLMLFLPFFAGRWPAHWGLYLLMMVLISVFFSALGLAIALWGEKWDQIAIPQTFIFTPLIWIGGSFSPLALLPGPLQTVARFNPIFYLLDGFRYAMLDVHEAPIWASFGLATLFAAGMVAVVLHLFRIGYKLRA